MIFYSRMSVLLLCFRCQTLGPSFKSHLFSPLLKVQVVV